ncbi:MAG: hypothetical protein ABJL72_18710 [Roseobacter sp.]
MKLNEFLTSSGTSMGSFGRTVGATTATISRIADGTVVPRKGLMKRIHLVTGGLVTPNDLVGLYCVQPCANANQLDRTQDRQTCDPMNHNKETYP